MLQDLKYTCLFYAALLHLTILQGSFVIPKRSNLHTKRVKSFVSLNSCVKLSHLKYSGNECSLILFRMGIFGAAHGWGGGQKGAPSLKSVTHILQWWNLAHLYLTQRRSKKYMSPVTNPLSSADISIFSPEISKFCYIKKYRYRLHFST